MVSNIDVYVSGLTCPQWQFPHKRNDVSTEPESNVAKSLIALSRLLNAILRLCTRLMSKYAFPRLLHSISCTSSVRPCAYSINCYALLTRSSTKPNAKHNGCYRQGKNFANRFKMPSHPSAKFWISGRQRRCRPQDKELSLNFSAGILKILLVIYSFMHDFASRGYRRNLNECLFNLGQT